MPLQGKYEVKLGRSFFDPSQQSFMTMRCDFLPASVDRDQPGTIKITNDSEVGVRLPNVSGAEPSSTLFKGNVRPVQKECLLIYNKRTGEVTLERISKAAQLKKIRDGPPAKKANDAAQSIAPPLQKHAPQSPPPMSSSLAVKPKVRTMSESSSDNELRDLNASAAVSQQKSRSSPGQRPPIMTVASHLGNGIPKRSTLSSSSSSSSSDSESEAFSSPRHSHQQQKQPPQRQALGTPSSLESLSDLADDEELEATSGNHQHQQPRSMPASSIKRDLVEKDLQLSDTDSDDDDSDAESNL